MKELRKSLFVLMILAAAFLNSVQAQDSTLFPRGQIGANTNNYTGTIWLSELNHPDSNFTFSLAQAVYAPGSKLDWHIHPGGQYLLITEGTGYYQEKGKPGQILHKGDIIKCLPGVEHWHGAAPNSTFSYVGVTPTQKGKTIWLKRVTDEEYNSIKK
jgi:4-carboxymuconolactone decarboxylase